MFLENRLIFVPRNFPDDDWHPAGLAVEDAWFQAAGGPPLHGWYVAAEHPRAVILFCHGNSGNVTHRLEALRQLTGPVRASVLIFDYRGYGRSQGRPDEPGILADARAARAWLAARTGLGENQIVLLGESIGCAVAVDLAADGARALVLQNAFSSLPDVAAYHYPCLPVRWFMRTRLDCLAKIGGYRGPLLQSHAERDTIVPIQLGRRLFEAAHEPKQFLVIPKRDHNDSLPLDYYHALTAFLAGPAAPAAVDQATSPIRPERPVDAAHKLDQSPMPRPASARTPSAQPPTAWRSIASRSATARA